MTVRLRARIVVIACTFAVSVPASLYAADSDSLLGIHFWGDRTDATPATMLDSVNRGGWDVEIVNTGNPQWNAVPVSSSDSRPSRSDELRPHARTRRA